MKRYIRASIDPSAPDWLKKALAGSFGQDLVKRAQVALDKANFSKEPTGSNTLPIYLLETDYSNSVYAPGINDSEEATINGRWRKLGSIAKSKLPQMAVDTVYVDLDDPANKYERRTKYQDPRYEYRYSDRGRYAGQYRRHEYVGNGEYEDAGWSEYGRTPSNETKHRDKSGYKIPKPEDMIARFYSRFPERITEKVNKVYAKLLDAQRELMSSSFNNVGQEWGDTNIRNAYSRFGDAVSEYKRLLYMVQNRRDEKTGELTNRYGRGEGYSEFSNQIKSIDSDLEDVREFLGLSSR